MYTEAYLKSTQHITTISGHVTFAYDFKFVRYFSCIMVEEEHGIRTYHGWMFSLPHFHFQFKFVNISTILTSKLKHVCIYLEICFLTITWNISCMEFSVNKQICLNCVFFLHRVYVAD